MLLFFLYLQKKQVMNQAVKPSAVEAHPHKWYRLPLSSDQKEELHSAYRAYFQNAKLSSKGMGIRQTEAAFVLLRICKYPDGTQVALIDGDFFLRRDGEEPQHLHLEVGHPDDPGPKGDNAADFDWYERGSSRSSDKGKT